MGQVPNRYPVYMNEISSALGGQNDLGYYRGRQYWNASGNLVTISGNAAMSEFPGLTNNPPYLSQNLYQARWNGGSINGYDTGFTGVYGGMSPTAGPGGNNINALYNDFSNGFLFLIMTGILPQAQFTSMEIVGVANLSSASAGYQPGYSGAFTLWSWATGNVVGATDYDLIFR